MVGAKQDYQCVIFTNLNEEAGAVPFSMPKTICNCQTIYLTYNRNNLNMRKHTIKTVFLEIFAYNSFLS